MTGSSSSSRRLIAYVGAYGVGKPDEVGGITVVDVSADGSDLQVRARVNEPRDAGYLVVSPALGTLYSVDERKTDGRGPVQPPAAVHAFHISPEDGTLTWLNSCVAPGPRPTFLALDEASSTLISANHGDFQHVEKVVRSPNGAWTSTYVYDDSTVVAYGLSKDGHLEGIRNVVVLNGHGPDPNTSPQNGGHAQASPHAHCAVVDPSGKFLLVCDKGTDQILVYRLGATLELASSLRLPAQTGPRHLEFSRQTGLAYATFEFASQVASFDFNATTGELKLLVKVSSVAGSFIGPNEPAEIRVHPSGRWVYANNRGEDSIAWFDTDALGGLQRRGHVSVAKSLHPGVAARSFAFSPDGTFMLAADRPAGKVLSFSVDPDTGALNLLGSADVAEPAFVAFLDK